MRIFSRLMDMVLGWSKHPRAPWYLGGLSFAESSFFPIPPDVMLAPMVMARPEQGVAPGCPHDDYLGAGRAGGLRNRHVVYRRNHSVVAGVRLHRCL